MRTWAKIGLLFVVVIVGAGVIQGTLEIGDVAAHNDSVPVAPVPALATTGGDSTRVNELIPHPEPPLPEIVVERAPVADFSSCKRPLWPKGALAARRTGTVTIAFKIDAQGNPVASKIEHSSGFKDLDKAARDAIALCQFKPGTRHGIPVEKWVQLQYVWTLK